MSYSLNSLKGGYIGDYIGDYYRVIKGGTRSLEYSSYGTKYGFCSIVVSLMVWVSIPHMGTWDPLG